MSTVTHMISIVVNDQLKIFKIFDILCLPLLPYMMVAKKLVKCVMHSKKSKKCQFGVGGTHIDVTTLERNHYLFSKHPDLSSKTITFIRKSTPLPCKNHTFPLNLQTSHLKP